MIDKELDIEICDFLMGWHKLEEKLGGPDIVDFNLIEHQTGKEYGSRWEVLNDLEKIQTKTENSNSQTAFRLKAQNAFLRNLMGEHWDFTRYIENTMGFTPSKFSEKDIEKTRAELEEELSLNSIKLDEKTEKNLIAKDIVFSPEEAKRFFIDTFDKNKEALEQIIGKVIPFNVNVEIVNEDAYWANWVDGGGENYRLRFNTFNWKVFDKSNSTRLAFHEMLGHFVHVNCWREAISNNELPRHFGLTTVHGPESFQMEGLADSLYCFFESDDLQDPIFKARVKLQYYKELIINNAQIDINSGKTIDEVVKYIYKYLPYETKDVRAHGLKSWVNSPQFRAYEHVYPRSYNSFKRIAESLSQSQKNEFLKWCYRNYLLPRDIKQKYPQGFA